MATAIQCMSALRPLAMMLGYRALINHADDDITSPLPGLLEGRAGVALTLHTIAAATPSGWPTCLLIN